MNDIVVEVRGGLVVEIYSDLTPVRFVVVDWDKIDDGADPFCWGEAAPLNNMPADTCTSYHEAVRQEEAEQAVPQHAKETPSAYSESGKHRRGKESTPQSQ